MAPDAAGPPPLSVVVATRQAWPAARGSLDSFFPELSALGGELVVPIGHPAARPVDADERYPGAVWVAEPGASVFRLRALGVARSRAPIVAVTEDHARPTPGWCATILAAHAAHPEAAAIGGVVENGATRTLVDWASFMIANGRFLPPADPSADTTSLQANISYKRAALDGASHADLGLMQHTLHADLRSRGARLLTDERLAVVHDQAHSARGHSAGHFHNGRSIAAFRAARFTPARRALYAVASAGLPPVMLWRTLRGTAGKRLPEGLRARAAPWVAWLLLCHAAGELSGYVTGPGSSPDRVM